jgi:hypothetical protein
MLDINVKQTIVSNDDFIISDNKPSFSSTLLTNYIYILDIHVQKTKKWSSKDDEQTSLINKFYSIRRPINQSLTQVRPAQHCECVAIGEL